MRLRGIGALAPLAVFSSLAWVMPVYGETETVKKPLSTVDSIRAVTKVDPKALVAVSKMSSGTVAAVKKIGTSGALRRLNNLDKTSKTAPLPAPTKAKK